MPEGGLKWEIELDMYLFIQVLVLAHPVTVEAVDLVVGSVGEVAGVELVFAVVAGEALLVVERALRDLLLRLEHAPAAPVRKMGSLEAP